MRNKEKQEKKIKEKVDYSILFGYMKKEKFLFVAYCFFNIISLGATLISLLVSTQMIESLTSGNLERTGLLLIMYSGLMIADHLFIMVAYMIFRKIIERTSIAMRQDLSKRIFCITSKSYNSASTGKFISRVTYTPRTILLQIWESLDAVLSIIAGVAICVYVFILNWIIGFAIVIMFAILILLDKKRTNIYFKNDKKSKKATDRVNSFINEVVRSEKDVKALNLEQSFAKMSEEIYSEDAKLASKKSNTDMNLWKLILIGSEVLITGILILAIYFTKSELIALSVLIFLIMNIDRIKSIALSIGRTATSFGEIKTEVHRLNEVFDESKYALERFGTENFDKEYEGRVELKNVTFSYDGEKNIIEDMNLVIPKGKTVAFVGKSGSGKTTLVSLISKLYEVTGGEILLDNKNINDLTKDALRSNIALINQFPYIFDNTIKENLRISNQNATDEEIWDVLEKADLKKFVEELPDKLETVVGENGVKLSGGQKQRLAIARAFLKPSKLLIFDESTSSLDNFAQAHVQESIEQMKGQKTIVIVAHRLSTIRNADIIFMVEEGKILNQGTFDYLFENEPKFKNMFVAENLEN